jgi:hypothetical protein
MQLIMVKNIVKYLFVLFILIAANTSIFAQGNIGVTAAAKVDTTIILLGEQITITLKVRTPNTYFKEGNTLIWHPIKDTLSKQFEVIEFSKIDTSLSTDGKTNILEQKIIVTSFDTGYHVIPPFQFQRNNEQNSFIETQPILVRVNDVEITEEEDLADIKGPLEQRITLQEILTYLAIFLGILVLAYLIFRYIKTRKPRESKPQIITVVPETPYYITVLEKLEELRNSDYLMRGKVKEYHAELSQIIRFYLGNRYEISALEQTTDEILKSLKNRPINPLLKENLQYILELSDLVKFAKNIPSNDDNKLAIIKAIEFVNETKLIEKPNITEEGEQKNDK